jgi:hypothetical protein
LGDLPRLILPLAGSLLLTLISVLPVRDILTRQVTSRACHLLVLTAPDADNTMSKSKTDRQRRPSQPEHAPPPPDLENQGSEVGDGPETLVDATEPASNARAGTPAPVTQPASNANAPKTPDAGRPRDNDGQNSTPFSKGTAANAMTMQSTKCVVLDVRTKRHTLMVVLKP